MTKKTIKTKFNSLEQWKAELFPTLIKKEREKNQDIKKLGTSLANKSIEKILATS